jgi:hypothetical protein
MAPDGIAPVGILPLLIPLGSAVGRVPVMLPVGRLPVGMVPPGAPPEHCVVLLDPLLPLLLDEPEHAASSPRLPVPANASAPKRSASWRLPERLPVRAMRLPLDPLSGWNESQDPRVR